MGTGQVSIRGLRIALIVILGLGVILPLPLLVNSPLHHDEALYAYWARLIVSGQDVMLNTVPVDKPPLFMYLLALFFYGLGVSATVARLPSLLGHLAIIGLTFQIGSRLYNSSTGLLAALLVALSPYTILFAPTALTDPLLVALILLAVWLAIRAKPGWAGLALALAAATKQQGVFFLPLIAGFVLLTKTESPVRQPPAHSEATEPEPRFWSMGRLARLSEWLFRYPLMPFFLAFTIGLLLPLIWDVNRLYRPGFWLQSSLSYGGLNPTVNHLVGRLLGFIDLLHYVTASKPLNLIFVVGLPLLFVINLITTTESKQSGWADGLLISFCLAFVALQALLSFQIWDRYLLGLVPCLCLLLARVLHLPAIRLKFGTVAIRLATFALVISLMSTPVRMAVNGHYPLGGDHGAFAGTAEISLYLSRHAGANVTLYHRWLGAHWRFYLFDFPYDLRFWQTADDLARQAGANAAGRQYIAFPAWQSTTPARLALSEVGLGLVPIFRTFRSDGTPAAILYQIEPQP